MTYQSGLIRCSRSHPCEICGRVDWCSYSRNGEIAFCMRKESDNPGKDGVGWTHILKQSPRDSYQTREIAHVPETPKPTAAPIESRDLVYRMLLDCLGLSQRDRDELLERGLTPAAIKANGYRSTPTKQQGRELTRSLIRHGLDHVPGFYKDAGEWRMVWTDEGYFIPVRDAQGRIAALMYRRRNYTKGLDAKYLWFSSAKRPNGTSSGCPVQHSNWQMLKGVSEITLTEGYLKADVCASLLNQPVIGSSPTGWGKDFAANLKAGFPNIQNVFVGLDMDWTGNDTVYRAMNTLIRQLEQVNFNVRVRTWPPEYKGLDDYIIAVARGEKAEVAA